MIVLIATITIILYILLIVFTLHNLKSAMDTKTKIAYIAIGLAIMYIITLIIFNMSSSGINYENSEMTSRVRNMLLAVFVPINGLILMPYLANLFAKTSSNEIRNENLKKRFIILVIIFILMLMLECSYFKSTQQGIINMINQR